MMYLAYFVVLFALIQLFVAIANLLFEIGLSPKIKNYKDLVSVLIPARNEEKNIANILTDLIQQQYQNIEIIVFDDMSTDNTAEIVNGFSKSDNRVTLIKSTGLEYGWFGKNYACHSLSNQAKGKYLLFLDADVRIGMNLIHKSISYTEKYKLGLVSIFPKQIILSLGEWLTVPSMNYILLTLLPLFLVRKSGFPSLSAANGQFMLFNASIYHKLKPHEQFKSNKVEDIEIARYYKSKGIKIACLPGNENIKCRMYYGFSDAVNGFSKNIICFFGNSFVLAVIFWFVTTLGFLAVWIGLHIKYLFLYLLLILFIRIIVSVISKQNVVNNVFFLIPQQIIMGLLIYKAIIKKLKNQYEWKGRNIS
jgi:glycosyltransferase involved in cell wall biosynthesis